LASSHVIGRKLQEVCNEPVHYFVRGGIRRGGIVNRFLISSLCCLWVCVCGFYLLCDLYVYLAAR